MKRLKSKKTGLEQDVSEEEYAAIVRKGVIPMNRFEVTTLKARPIVPSLKTDEPIKITKKTKE
jgi:hypothetical protein